MTYNLKQNLMIKQKDFSLYNRAAHCGVHDAHERCSLG